MKFRLLSAFALAFVSGILVAAGGVRPNDPSNAEKALNSALESRNSDAPDENSATPAIAWPLDTGSPEQLIYAQPERMRRALNHLSPRTPGKANLFLISFAGDGEENVFRNEAEYVEKLFGERFGAAGHVLTLINNPATLEQRPIASLSNLEIAIDGIGRKMQPNEDVLMVFITTHGSRDHELYVSLDPLPLDQIAPDDLADLFIESPIKHRVFVISACYSGGFVDALKNPDTMIITAARSDRTSFGCGTQSAITDFGRAFFVDALNRTASFADAYGDATREVTAWETRDHQVHSYPQISTGAPIEAALKAWRDEIKLGPAVPFGIPSQKRPAPAGSDAQK